MRNKISASTLAPENCKLKTAIFYDFIYHSKKNNLGLFYILQDKNRATALVSQILKHD